LEEPLQCATMLQRTHVQCLCSLIKMHRFLRPDRDRIRGYRIASWNDVSAHSSRTL